ncbi:MAG: Flp family type IVb pilin [Firmicutes bacterium]|nr:Flp family type IVb pilin [Bacillota bacterium]
MLSTLWFYLKTRFMLDEEGQGMVEYGLILALVALLAIGALSALGGGLDTILTNVKNALFDNTPAGS